jgi:hypothetical protein
MTSFWQLPAAVLTLLIAFTEGPGTLGTLARREAMRRQMTGQAKASLSNLSLPEPPPPAVSSDTSSGAAGDPSMSMAAAVAAAEGGQKPDEKKDEGYWRERMAKARQALAKDEAALPVAEAKVQGMTTEVVNMDDPARQSKLRQQLMVSMAEVERLKGQIEADRKAIADIQSEARRAGIPPGWIR